MCLAASVAKEWKNNRESWREAVVVGEGECDESREIESWSLVGRAERREVMERESVTETMDSGWGSDFHSNSLSLPDADAMVFA